ncbi:MAG: prolyl oligopeptidase family serine peptidase [Planctomycetota bacterium]
MSSIRRVLVVLCALAGLGPALPAQEELAAPPKGKDLEGLVRRYLEADESERVRIREDCDRLYAPLPRDARLARLRKELLEIASEVGPEISWKGRNYLLDEKTARGKYLARGGGKSLWIGLHGGGHGVGSAESAAGAMGGLGARWLFPEVLEKTSRGWTDADTDKFVIELIRAAKRSGKVDPDRIYVTGHSMGGYGAWTLGAHHADVFAGAAAYAGAPSPMFGNSAREIRDIEPGVLPSYFRLPLFFYQSLDDRNVPPEPNVFANKALLALKEQYGEGFEFRYQEVDGRGHAAPAEGYQPSQKWIGGFRREARPKRFLWQPAVDWKKHMYWLHWQKPERGTLVDAQVTGPNEILVTLDSGEFPRGMSVLLGAPLVDPEREVKIRVNGFDAYRGVAEARLSTLLMTLPRHDDALLFDTRVDLKAPRR